MSEKELLYMEDAVKHTANLIDIYKYIEESLNDKDLSTFMNTQLKSQEKLKQKLLDVMEGAANE